MKNLKWYYRPSARLIQPESAAYLNLRAWIANNYNNKKDKAVKNINVQSIFGISVALFLGAAVAFAGSQGGASFNGMPVFVICGLLAFGMNWLGYIPSYIAQTEHYYDFMGSFIFFSIKEYRDLHNNGFISFSQCIKVGISVGVFSAIIFGFWKVLLINYIDSDYADLALQSVLKMTLLLKV